MKLKPMGKRNLSNLLSILAIIMLISACRSATQLPSLATPAVSLSQSVTIELPGTATPSLSPVEYLDSSNLDDLQKVAKSPIWLPTYIPHSLQFYKAWIASYANGDENIRVLYSEPGDPLDAKRKMLDIQMTVTDEPVSMDTISRQYKIAALDVQEVTVRGQRGFTYWTQSVAAGNSAYLVWREESMNFLIALSGNWPQPSKDNPHALDGLLLKIAESLENVH